MSIRAPRAAHICARCLGRRHSRRSYATTSASTPAPPASGAAKLTTRRLISLHGEEAPKFLQGLVTNNVRTETQAGFYAAFLTAPGKVLNDVFVYPTLGSHWHKETNHDEQQGFLVEVDADQAELLLKHIKKHKLRAKFKLRLLEQGELDVWSVWKEDERWRAHGRAPQEDGVLGLTDCRAPGMGQRLLFPSTNNVVASTTLSEVDEAPLSAYTIRRYLRGVPEGQKEIPREESLPMNYNFDIMGGIDFKKGCYLGQELTIRTHHTGVVRRRILPVMLYPQNATPPESLEYETGPLTGEMVEEGTEIRRDDKRKRPTGKLTASVGNVGLGMCRLEQMSDLTVSSEGSSFSPDDRFIVQGQDSQELGVKAFVPDWVRGSIRGPRAQKRVE